MAHRSGVSSFSSSLHKDSTAPLLPLPARATSNSTAVLLTWLAGCRSRAVATATASVEVEAAMLKIVSAAALRTDTSSSSRQPPKAFTTLPSLQPETVAKALIAVKRDETSPAVSLPSKAEIATSSPISASSAMAIIASSPMPCRASSTRVLKALTALLSPMGARSAKALVASLRIAGRGCEVLSITSSKAARLPRSATCERARNAASCTSNSSAKGAAISLVGELPPFLLGELLPLRLPGRAATSFCKFVIMSWTTPQSPLKASFASTSYAARRVYQSLSASSDRTASRLFESPFGANAKSDFIATRRTLDAVS
mmetsp:Transcript_42146/g.98848  ORF Transcript_42146/g.98848 Transcript_42146/m.98848 type:complete len:315 (+) Transcript_42146:575-1519(+)